MNSRRHRRTGAAAVELAFVAPVFFLLLFGLIEFSRTVMLQQALTNAAREGARLSAMASTVNSQDVDTRVREKLVGALADPMDTSKVRVAINPQGNLKTLPSKTIISVDVDVSYAEASWLIPQFLGSAELHGGAHMKRE